MRLYRFLRDHQFTVRAPGRGWVMRWEPKADAPAVVTSEGVLIGAALVAAIWAASR